MAYPSHPDKLHKYRSKKTGELMMHRAYKTQTYMTEFNKWRILWRDVEEDKVFTPMDIQYAKTVGKIDFNTHEELWKNYIQTLRGDLINSNLHSPQRGLKP